MLTAELEAGLGQLADLYDVDISTLIRKALEDFVPTATGWRHNPEHGWVYTHARGMISASGGLHLPTVLSGALSRYELPDPTRNAAWLRQAFLEHSGPALLKRYPPHVMVVLLGQVYLAPVLHNPYPVVLHGGPGSGKTTLASVAMDHLAYSPQAIDQRAHASTLNRFRSLAARAKDSVLYLDNLPASGAMVVELIRLLHTQESRERIEAPQGPRFEVGQIVQVGRSIQSDQTPVVVHRQSTMPERESAQPAGPHTSGLLVTEKAPPGAAMRRAIPVALGGDREWMRRADADPVDPMERGDQQRRVLMSSYISWLAGDLAGARRTAGEVVQTEAAALRAADHDVRRAEALAHIRAGWSVMTTFLIEVDALSRSEADSLLESVDEILRHQPETDREL